MAKEQYLNLAGLEVYTDEIKSHIETVADEKADIQHNHTVSEITDLLDLTEEEIAELCEFDGNPDNIIPIASKASMGCVVAGDGLDIDDNGVLSVQSLTDEEIESICEFDEGMTEDNVIPKASTSLLGCVIVGDGLEVDTNGVLSSPAISMELLWENASPTSDFAAQTISLDLSEYDEVEIEYICHGSTSHKKRVKGKIGEAVIGDMVMSNVGYTAGSTVYAGFRAMQINSNGIAFQAACSYVATANNLVKPIKIYGIKGVK